MVSCAVRGCSSHSRKKIKGTSFFTFPKDPNTRAVWMHRCARKEINFETARVCSEHFRTEDFDPSFLMRRSLMKTNNTGRKRAILGWAVPSLNLISSAQSR